MGILTPCRRCEHALAALGACRGTPTSRGATWGAQICRGDHALLAHERIGRRLTDPAGEAGKSDLQLPGLVDCPPRLNIGFPSSASSPL
jgi:hypothetical protein